MKKISLVVLVLFALTISLFSADNGPKYIFYFIGDGMSYPQRMAAEEFSRGIGKGSLIMNKFPNHATTRTSSANRLVTDSAASGTALACGEKTNNGTIGLAKDQKTPVTSAAVKFQQAGRKIGIATTVTINHATPSSFYGHRPSRQQYYLLGLDLLDSKFDYFASAGFGSPDDKKCPQYKGNLYVLTKKAGYEVVSNADKFLAIKPSAKKVFAYGPCPFAINNQNAKFSQAAIIKKGIELLDNPKGFFFMFEGGKIDYAGHANDLVANIHETLALDSAVKVAYEFYLKHPKDTLIIVAADHETGGMTLKLNKNFVKYISLQKMSSDALYKKLNDEMKAKKGYSFEDAKKFLNKYCGFDFTGKDQSKIAINVKEAKELEKAFASKKLHVAVKYMIADKVGVSWSTTGHSALPILCSSIGPQSEKFTGFIENTEIANKLKAMVK